MFEHLQAEKFFSSEKHRLYFIKASLRIRPWTDVSTSGARARI